jgi:lathosterol oxidase
MEVWNWLVEHVGKGDPVRLWLTLFIAGGIVFGIASGFFKARKIQPKGFKWKTFRNEAIIGTINVAISGTIIGFTTVWLRDNGYMTLTPGPAAWWVILLEYAAYFFLFDTWFYWLHRWMHKEPVYSWVHKLHHWSTSPNLLTNISVNPLESFINGGFVPLFLVLIPVHEQTLALITPTNIIIGFWIHSGYELFPRWWNKSWATKWLITTTFHDQHHKYFTVNFGGYTTIWDRICGTMRPKYEADFEKIKDRARAPKVQETAPAVAVEQG